MRRSPPFLILALAAASGGPALAGETACWFENGAVVAPAALGPVTGDFVIDLSAPATLLHIDVAQGQGFTDTALTLPVRLADQRIEAAPIRVTSLDYRAVGFSTPIVGVIGADILDRYVVSLDASPCRLRLDAPGQALQAPREPSLAVTVVGGVATVLAAASDGRKGVAGPFALDTASDGGVRARGAANGPRQKPAGDLPALSFDGEVRQDVPAVVAGELPPGVVGALGMRLLAAYRLRLDAQAGRLWLTPKGREPDKEKGPGVTAEP